MRKNEYLLVLDTETANSVQYPLPYDLGYKIFNRKREVVETRSFCIYEIFCEEKDLMQSAYYAEKLPQYYEELKRKQRKLVRLYTARKTILEDMQKYKIDRVYAYNMGFDRRALNNDQKYTTKNKYKFFFPRGTEFRCIWNMACQVLLARPSYIKFALQNGYVSAKGNILTNAECCYRYISKDTNFVEAHKGIDDVNIEAEILLACFAQHKKMDTKPYSACWRLVQKKHKEMRERVKTPPFFFEKVLTFAEAPGREKAALKNNKKFVIIIIEKVLTF